jgi:hypothetical protein
VGRKRRCYRDEAEQAKDQTVKACDCHVARTA